MVLKEITSLEEAKNLVLGATILGTGGGGDPKEGLQMLEEVLSKGKTIKLASLDEIPSNQIIVSAYHVGSIAPGLKTRKPVRIGDPVRKAIEEIEGITGRKVGAIVASEIGGGNTPVALKIASELDIPAIDGDLLGRAAPELHQCTVHIFGYPMYPAAIVTETGNIVLVKEYADIDDYESIARYISVLGGRYCSVVDTPLSIEKARNAVVPGTITLSINLGRIVNEAKKRGEDPVVKAVEALGGWIIFEGIVKEYNWRNEGGFLKGEAVIDGTGRYVGHNLRTWIMNEHIMVWRDNNPIVMPPDLMSLLTPQGDPVTNTELKEGMKVIAIAAKAPEVWRTEKGLEYFGPKHFGFDYEYVPVEKLVEENRL